MIGYLKGTIKYQTSNWIILDVNGVGYKVYINPKSQTLNSKQIQNPKSKSQIGNSLEVYIYHHLREDVSDLYGFLTIEELQMFELLLEVPGVGPKIAMNILAKTGVDRLREAIGKGDSTLLTAISGVGKKMAMKILVELKHKLASETFETFDTSDASLELISAMESLGYKKGEIYPVLAKIPSDLKTIQEKVKWILRHAKTR